MVSAFPSNWNGAPECRARTDLYVLADAEGTLLGCDRMQVNESQGIADMAMKKGPPAWPRGFAAATEDSFRSGEREVGNPSA
jgi:hypothetical protein